MVEYADGICLCPGCGIETVRYRDGIGEEDAMCERCYNEMSLREMTAEDLDSIVDVYKSEEASDINSRGKEAQIDYLLEAGWMA